MSLVDLWREDRENIRGKSVHQILAFAGDGKLTDGGACSAEFRQLLSTIELKTLARFSSDALDGEAQTPGLALQDIVNELDRGHRILIEVKSSSTWAIPLKKIMDYRARLIRETRVEVDQSSVLLVVCKPRESTEDLEAQIRGSKYAWDIRLLSLDALVRMVELKNATDRPDSARRLRELLVPREYTKLDSLLDVVSFVAEDVVVGNEELDEEGVATSDRAEKRYQSKLDRTALRKSVTTWLEGQVGPLRAVSRTLFESPDGTVGVCYSPSRPYPRGKYTGFWFGLHAHQVEFVGAHRRGYIAYLCAGSGLLFMPWTEFTGFVDRLLKSSKDGREWNHVILQVSPDRKVKMRLRKGTGETRVDLTRFLHELPACR